MTATVRDARGITHVAVRYDSEEGPLVNALCKSTIMNVFFGESFMAWNPDEIGEDPPDCMSCLAYRNEP